MKALRDTDRPEEARFAAAVDPSVEEVLADHPLREFVTVEGPYPVYVDRERALYGSWYELFPRSEGARVDVDTGRVVPGTLRTAARRLDAVAAMGFDVVYLPPIHPIGTVNRKGPNNTLDPGPDDVGSPWAIGSADGGHDAVHPDLGTIADFDAFVARSPRARTWRWRSTWRCRRRPTTRGCRPTPSGSPRAPTAPSPTRRTHRRSTRTSTRSTSTTTPRASTPRCCASCGCGCRTACAIFRVDNPHTKPVEFWEWLLARCAAATRT